MTGNQGGLREIRDAASRDDPGLNIETAGDTKHRASRNSRRGLDPIPRKLESQLFLDQLFTAVPMVQSARFN